MELTMFELIAAMGAAFAGGVIQGSIGFGLSLVVVPILGLVAPNSLPATILFVSLPMTVWMAARERAAIDRRGFAEISIGRLPGTALAVWVLTLLATSELVVLIGAVVLMAALLSVVAPDFELRTRWRLLAGVVSGFMGTAAAVGGPPLAIAYQRRPGPQLRSTLAATFVLGSTISLLALGIAGEVRLDHLLLALELLPALAAGLFVSTRLHTLLDRAWLRPTVLAFAAFAGAAAIVRGLL